MLPEPTATLDARQRALLGILACAWAAGGGRPVAPGGGEPAGPPAAAGRSALRAVRGREPRGEPLLAVRPACGGFVLLRLGALLSRLSEPQAIRDAVAAQSTQYVAAWTTGLPTEDLEDILQACGQLNALLAATEAV